MLSRFDDYPVHQTPEPIARVATSDRNAYDRYWLNGYSADGEFYFGVALGLYPNLRIMDGAFSIVRGGEQHALHVSRRAPAEPSETEIGPFRLEVVEPMRRLRLAIEPNETGIEADLVFEARTACVEEKRQTMRRDGRILLDGTRFAQFGRWRGEIRYAGQRVQVAPGRVLGTKDRSWGIRPIGPGDPAGAPSSEAPQVFFLWAPLHWEDCCTHFIVFEDERGRPWHEEGMVIPAYVTPEAIPGVEDAAVEHAARIEHRLEYEPGTRRARRAEIALVRESGERIEIALEPLLCFRMKGIGYTHPEWGHGHWKGELAVAGESWRTSEIDEMAIENQHVQQVVRATWEDRRGVGVLEQLAFGPHARYGFRELLDPAREPA